MTLNEEKLALLRAAVAAQITLWDALSDIEHMYLGTGDVPDKAADGLVELVSALGAATDDSTAWIDAEHVTQLDEVMSRS